jgi:hypothetical protein
LVEGTVKKDEYDAIIREYSERVIGAPPPNFKAIVNMAQAVGKFAFNRNRNSAKDLMEACIIAALAVFETNEKETGGNHVAFIQRVKQVIKWCDGPWRPPTPMEEMENRQVEMGRQIALRLHQHEAFLLLTFNKEAMGPEYGISHISSIRREDAIEMLDDYLKSLKGVPIDAKVIIGMPGRRTDDNDIN